MKNKLFNNSNQLVAEQAHSSTINIENSSVLDIFGVNNENLKYFEKNLSLKVYQKGNQLNLKGNAKDINILKNAIRKTINDKKVIKTSNTSNLMKKNLETQIFNERENIKNINITKTNKLDVIGKSKNQNYYLEILKKKQIIFAVGPA